MKIKICGIINLDDALRAADCGADMLGFNFYPGSPRMIQPSDCTTISSELERRAGSVVRVGVFVNMPPADVVATVQNCGLHFAQLSGDEPLSDLADLKGMGYKALRVSNLESARAKIAEMPFRSMPPACLLDASVPGQFGGTGKTVDWSIAAQLAREFPILLAGGLTPGNVAEAVHRVRPWGVDVASGVESQPGKKDFQKARDFIREARSVVETDVIRIEAASRKDLADILALQKLAYQSEAELNQDFNIPPLTQTLAEIEAEFACKLFLVATVAGRLVGSVRAELKDDTCHIGRLIVHPDTQNRGLGTRLMDAVERRFEGAKRYELFTSERSTRNIYLYQKLGYQIFDRKRLDDRVNLVYLEKRNPVL
jgi:phosphoribosylanthranilate isomerase